MRKIGQLLVLGATALVGGATAFAQSKGQLEMKGDLYSMALLASVDEMQKSWGYINDGGEGRARTDYSNVVVKQDPKITDGMPTQFGTHHVDYLDAHALRERYKELGKEFSILEIGPIHNDGARLHIVVSVYWFKYQRGRYFFAYSDWSDVEFQFNGETQAFDILDVKLGGI